MLQSYNKIGTTIILYPEAIGIIDEVLIPVHIITDMFCL